MQKGNPIPDLLDPWEPALDSQIDHRLCHEVDFVVEGGNGAIPVEAKMTATPAGHHAEAIERFQKLLGQRPGKGMVVCLCRERFTLTRTVDAVPLGSFWQRPGK